MLAKTTLALLAGAALCGAALAAEPDPRLPLIDAGASPRFEHRIAWSPGVRRSPALLRRLQDGAREDRAAFEASVKAEKGRPEEMTGRFDRGVEERFASERLQSVLVVTRHDGVRSFGAPLTWDLRADRPLGWADLFTDAGPGSPALKAVAAYVAAKAAPAYAKRSGNPKGSREYGQAVGWIGPRADALPGFTLVPAREPGRIAGLSLHLGPRARDGLAEPVEAFLPATVLSPHLAPAWRDAFGGEPVLVDRATQRAIDEPFTGMPAFLLGPESRPARVLTVRGEIPEAFVAGEGVELVLYPDSDEGRKPVRATATLEPPGRTAGIAWGTRAFTVTFRSAGKPLDNSCRTESIHVLPAKGSPAAAAGLKPVSLSVPIKVSCGDYDG
jgi:hypothetical protein